MSDHFPISLESSPIPWGPTSFQFENMWLSHSGFRELVGNWWKESLIEGWGRFVVMTKLKALKERLKCWNKEVFGVFG